MTDTTLLLRRWLAWDAHPSRHKEANGLEDEVQRVAFELGISGSQLRDQVTARRKGGLSLKEAMPRFHDVLIRHSRSG